MDKGNFETYEYVPENNSNRDRFYVMQDNGTFLISRHSVPFSNQEQNVKEQLGNVQQCTVYDVSSQQFLVDVNHSSELIPVPEQFILPEGENTLYTSNYLLQAESSASTEPMEEDATEYQTTEDQITLEGVVQISKQVNNCTEITLTDEQYQMLEQKGWLLLEINDKIYILDTLGLHDITSNDKLIQKLKTESQYSISEQIDTGTVLQENGPQETNEQNLTNEVYVIENNISVENDIPTEDTICITVNTKNNGPLLREEKNQITNTISTSEPILEENSEQVNIESETDTQVLVIENDNIQRVGNTLKVKTKLTLKDFPDKIVLGKTPNGNNLVAKVRRENCDRKSENIAMPTIKLNSDNLLIKSEFYQLLQYFFQNNISKWNAEDVVAADLLISQLLQIETFKSSVMNNNLIITKIVQNEESPGKIVNRCLSAVVTGRVSLIAGQWRFVHLPHMLQNMVTDTELLLSRAAGEKDAINNSNYNMLHVQISEAKQLHDNNARRSVTVNKRNIPVHLIVRQHKKARPSTVYACSTCAAVFNTELELRDHQADHGLEREDMLTIDMEQLVKPSDYCVINTGTSKSYTCMQCNAKFSRLTTCKNHLKTHFAPKGKESDENAQPESNTSESGLYKCNMCPGTYFHPATLSKHIVARHIRIET